jgi:hypothetical protein
MIRRDANGWNGYTFRWEEDQRDAVLLSGKLNEDVVGEAGAFTWSYPSRSQCDHCHVERLNYTVGVNTRQLNRLFDYDGVTFNQLAALANAGYVTLPELPSQLPKFADPRNNDETLEHRVRALLDANCANCHQPDGPSDAEIDLRETTPFAETKLCNVEPLQGDLDIQNPLLLAPGDPARSVLLQRMLIRGKDQMPPIGSNLVDRFGSAMVGAWIQEMAACP